MPRCIGIQSDLSRRRRNSTYENYTFYTRNRRGEVLSPVGLGNPTPTDGSSLIHWFISSLTPVGGDSHLDVRLSIMENRPTSYVLAQAGWGTQRLRRFARSPLILRILIQTNITRARRSRFTSRHKIVDYGKSTYNPFLNPFVGARFPRQEGWETQPLRRFAHSVDKCPPSCPDVSAVLFLRITHHVSG